MNLTQDAANTPGFTTSAKKRNAVLLYIAHIMFWAIFLSIPAIFNPRLSGLGISRFVVDMAAPPRYINALLLIIVFYFNSYVAIPRFYFTHRYLVLTSIVLASFVLFFLINYMMVPPEFLHSPNFPVLGNSFNLFMFIMTYAFSFIICLYQQYHKIKEEELITKISFLTAQINPHFLFNTLNSIYSLSLAKSDKTPDAIVKLSGMMRYSVSEGSRAHVALTKEIEYIKSYVALQQLRLTEEVTVDFTVSGDPDNIYIPPFLLISFIENAFKHGVNGEEPSTIAISIQVGADSLRMDVRNPKVYIRPDREAGMGLGIATTRQRLELLYPGKHLLAIKNEERAFDVSLQIQF